MATVTVTVVSRRRSPTTIARDFPGALVVDVTSKGPEPWVRLSPFYPHGGIPVPMTHDREATSVEGIWQALKVFETADVDPTKLDVTTMRGIKRTVRRFGPVLGHRAGLHGDRLLPYLAARHRIYLPAYRWMLDNLVTAELDRLRRHAAEGDLVLLDYNTNGDIEDASSPLSHAALVRLELLDAWPTEPGA